MPDKNLSLSDMLRPVFNKAIKNYLDFTNQAPVLEAKDFTAYHNACKSDLAHLILLEKLMKQPAQNNQEMSLLDLIEQAKKENEHEHFIPDEFT